MARLRAADDFPAIRARMEELRRERAVMPAEDVRRVDEPRPCAVATTPALTTGRPGLSPAMRRAIQRATD